MNEDLSDDSDIDIDDFMEPLSNEPKKEKV